MSILIKGVDLPKAGEHYLIQLNSDGTIYDAVGQRTATFAVELPPHGRLIDADAVQKTVLKLIEDGWDITRNDYKRMDDILFECPTIIESNRKEG